MASRPYDILASPTQRLVPSAAPAQPTLMDAAKQQYPYLVDKNIAYVYTPDAQTPNQLEFYSPTEQGDPSNPRPQGLPLGQVGLQVYKPDVAPKDILADYVSHYAVHTDPKLNALYTQFANSLDPNVMKQRYIWDVQNEGEKRSFDDWMQSVGVPAAFRGYTFDQWPAEFNQHFYNPEQIKILDQVRKEIGYGGSH